MKEGYKQTELGEIPESWSVVKLGDVLINNPEYGANASAIAYTEQTYRYVRITDINENGNLLTSNKVGILKEAGEQYLLKDDDVLIARTGNTVGKSYLHKSENGQCAFAGYLIRFKLNNELYNPVLLFHYLHSPFFWSWVNTTIRTGAQPNINSQEYQSLKISKPPLPEQNKIASILSTIDEKIEVIETRISEIEELKKGLMQQLLTKGIGHTKFKNSTLGEIPESWEVVKLESVSEFSNGKGHEQSIDENGKYIVVNSKFISTDGNVKKYSNENLCPLFNGDIVIVMSDIPNGKAIAKCFLVDEDSRYTLNQRIGAIKATTVNNLFLYYILNRNSYYLAFDNGASQTNLRKEEVLHCPVPVPPLEEQNKIASIFYAVDEKLKVLQAKKETYAELKKGLMQQLLTGKIRVKTN